LYGLRYAEFVVPLVKAVQEQQEMIRELHDLNELQQKTIDILNRQVNSQNERIVVLESKLN
jgi:hypothetical protein